MVYELWLTEAVRHMIQFICYDLLVDMSYDFLYVIMICFLVSLIVLVNSD
jgi:hypothetical protein